MKKFIPIFLSILCIIMLLSACEDTDKITITGYYLSGKDGAHIIVDGKNPIIMTNVSSKTDIFNGLENGDKIKVSSSYIQEIYPCQSNIYSCKLLEKGTIESIDPDAIASLQELGWY